jgi:beta-phosphoglucomutase-like phosphatase (HAD superfamily)
MIDAVMCELEGVLIDSSAQRCRALQHSLADEGLTLSDTTYYEHCAGRNTDIAVQNALRVLGKDDDGALATLLVLRSNDHFARLAASGVLLAPGAVEFLESVRASTRAAVVTRATRREAELMLAVAGLDSAFDCLICAEDAPAPKPSGAPYEAALARLGRRSAVDRRRAVALEDGVDGIRASVAARVRCIAVGALPAHELIGADGVVASIVGETPASLEALLVRVEENVA